MFLTFSSDIAKSELYIGVVASDYAYIMDKWFNEAEDIPAQVQLTDIPTIKFSSAIPADHQTATWVKSVLFLTRVTADSWKWNTTKTKMPPTQVTVSLQFQMAIPSGPLYKCTGLSPMGMLMLVVQNDSVPNILDTLLPAHALKIAEIQDDTTSITALKTAPMSRKRMRRDFEDTPPPSPNAA